MPLATMTANTPCNAHRKNAPRNSRSNGFMLSPLSERSRFRQRPTYDPLGSGWMSRLEIAPVDRPPSVSPPDRNSPTSGRHGPACASDPPWEKTNPALLASNRDNLHRRDTPVDVAVPVLTDPCLDLDPAGHGADDAPMPPTEFRDT